MGGFGHCLGSIDGTGLEASEWRSIQSPLPWPLPREHDPGHDHPRPFADAHVYIRLYDRRRGGFPESLVFDEVTTTEPVRMMRGAIWHQSVRDLASFAKKEARYFALQTVEIKATPKRRLKWALRLPFEYPFQFLKYYFGRRHVTGGLFGLKFSHVMAAARWKRLVMLLRGRREDGAKAAGLKT